VLDGVGLVAELGERLAGDAPRGVHSQSYPHIDAEIQRVVADDLEGQVMVRHIIRSFPKTRSKSLRDGSSVTPRTGTVAIATTT
jgi:hypothetical protein